MTLGGGGCGGSGKGEKCGEEKVGMGTVRARGGGGPRDSDGRRWGRGEDVDGAGEATVVAWTMTGERRPWMA